MGAREKLADAKAKRDAAKAAKIPAEAKEAPAKVPDEVFAKQKGLPANVKAKELAQAKSRKKADVYPTFYSQKGLKVIKFICKPGKTVSQYVGNLSPKKHKAMLETLIAGWQKAGVWVPEHEAKAKCSAIQAEFEKKG